MSQSTVSVGGAGLPAGEERPAETMQRLLRGAAVTQALCVATELGIADLLKDGPRHSDDLAAAAGADPRALYRLMRALATIGVFREEDGRRFALTPLAACLRSDAPEQLAARALLVGQPAYWQAYGALLHSVRTGENAFRHVHGVDIWTYNTERDPEANAAFNRNMTANSRREAPILMAAYDFSPFGTIVDVAGGHGALLAAILAQHPHVQGVLFDQPHVVAGAAPVLRAAGADVTARCQTVGGSFFDALPLGGDAYLLKHIIHDWADAEAIAILRRCREAMGAGAASARLLVIERRLAPANQGEEAKFANLNMLVLPGGQERDDAEYGALFAAAGFRLAGVTPTASPLAVFEGVPV